MGKRTGGGGRAPSSNLHRTEVITLRLEPEVRFQVGLATRRNRQTVSHFVEEAVKKALAAVCLRDNGASVPEVSSVIWDPLEADCFVKLALRYPELLTYEERLLWKLIVECDAVWAVDRAQRLLQSFQGAEAAVDFPLLRAYWDVFKQAARDGDPERLPPALYPRHRLQDVSTPPQVSTKPSAVRRASGQE